MKKVISIASALMLCLSFCSCGKEQEKKEEISIPILETNEENYNTVTAEIGSITMSYTVEGKFSYPYSSYVSVDKGGVVKKLHFDASEELEAGQLMIEFENTEFDLAIEEQEKKVSEAQKNYDDLKNSGASKAKLDIAQVDLDIEKNELEKLKNQLEAYNVYAPIGGYIEMEGLIEDYAEGNTIEDGRYIGRIIDRSEKLLTAEVFGSKLENVEYGTKATITQGNVASATGTVRDVLFNERGDFSTYEYVIAIDDDTEFYDFGQIQINFGVYEKSDVVIVPQDAIVNVGSRTFVYTIVDGIRIETDVELGITDEIKGIIEITSGLNGGETIVI